MTGMIIGSIVISIFGYLLGSLSFAIIISKYKYKEDIRDFGSGNAGSTNIQRRYGIFLATLVLIFDSFKSYAAVWIAVLFILYVPFFHNVNPLFAGFFAVIGHCWPVYFKFKGGKGAASIYGFLCFYNPIIIAFAPALFWFILLSTRYASIASLLSLPIVTIGILLLFGLKPGGMFDYPYPSVVIHSFSTNSGIIITNVLYILSIVLLYHRHRLNIKKLVTGKETKYFKKVKKV